MCFTSYIRCIPRLSVLALYRFLDESEVGTSSHQLEWLKCGMVVTMTYRRTTSLSPGPTITTASIPYKLMFNHPDRCNKSSFLTRYSLCTTTHGDIYAMFQVWSLNYWKDSPPWEILLLRRCIPCKNRDPEKSPWQTLRTSRSCTPVDKSTTRRTPQKIRHSSATATTVRREDLAS